MTMKRMFAALTAAAMLGTMTVFPVSAVEEPTVLTEEEGNNSLGTANELPANASIQGALESKSDKDYYKLEVEEGGKLSMKFSIEEAVTTSTAYTYWNVSLCNADGNVIRKHTINGSATTFYPYATGLDAGTYYIVISCDNHSAKPYTLTAGFEAGADWETESNNSRSTADALPLNTPFGGSLHSSSDQDFYQFELEEDAAVDIVFQLEDIITESTVYKYYIITLYSDDGSAAAIKTYNVNGSLMTYKLNTVGLGAGTYYINISCNNHNSRSYSLNVKTTTGTDWESEYNDTLKTADTLPLDTPFYANLQNSSDKDYFQFTLEEQGAVNLTFDIETAVTDSTAYTYWTASICSEDGNTISSYEINGSKTFYDLTTLGLDAGTYYVRIERPAHYHSSQTYTLTASLIKDALWEGEFNDTMSTADEMTANTPISGRIHAGNGKDYYKLTLDKSGTVDLSFVIEPNSSNTNDYWQVTLMDENGTSLVTKAISGENATTSLPEYKAAAGTYYVLVENDSYYYWTTKYTLTANFEEDTYVLGDVNEDGSVNSLDAASALVAAANIGSGSESGLSETQEMAANVNEDDAINAIDAAAILSYAAAIGSGETDVTLKDFV